MGKIFISYLRRDKDHVARLVKELTGLGADIWWDEDSIAVGDRWRSNIDSAIRECDYFIPCFSRAFPRWRTSTMEKEVRIAAGLWRARAATDRKWILPVKLEDCEMPKIPLDDSMTLEDLHWIRLDGGDWHAGICSIADIVLERPKQQARKDLRRLAEAAVSAGQIKAYAAAAAMMGDERAKAEAARAEAHARERDEEYWKAHSAYAGKYKDGYNPLTDESFDEIIKEHERNFTGCMILWWIVCLFALAILALFYWISNLIPSPW